MEIGNKVFLLVGPRGSGKSHYVKLLTEKQPDLTVVSRDEILMQHFGSVHNDGYAGAGFYAHQLMEDILRQELGKESTGRILLDCWTGESTERRILVSRLHDFGADRVIALYFITPAEVVEDWFWRKPEIAKTSERGIRQEKRVCFFDEGAPRRDHALFHRLASEIDSDGFDEVIRIDPQKVLLVLD